MLREKRGIPGPPMLRIARRPNTRWLAALGAAVAVLAAFVWADVQTASAQPAGGDLLRITGEVTYVVRPDDGPVQVTWQVDIENNDPATRRQDFGSSYFYQSVSVPVLRGASATRATGPGGGPLGVEVDDSGEGPTASAGVLFDRALHYGERYAFTLSYELADARSEILLVTAAYVYLPAIVVGDSATVRVVVPDDREWDVILEPFDCPESDPGEYVCSSSEGVQIAVWVEVTKPDALRSTESVVQLADGEIALTISHFHGEERWASHIQEMSGSALPALESLFGFPYQGPRSLTVTERGRRDIAGYEGTFGCLVDFCTIGISPVADDSVALHELAHLWTEMFEKRWLAEGLAQFMTNRAAEGLGALVSTQKSGPPPRTVDLQLDEWGPARYIIGASEEDLAREYTGYWESERFFETLEQAIGLPALQTANASAAGLARDIDSQTYLDLLEDASGVHLDGLFLEHIFPPSYGPVLEQRRRAQERLVLLQANAAAAELHLRERTQDLVDAWSFDSAERAMDDAEAALDAYNAARDRLDEPRSFWEKVGLWGRNPDAELESAAAEFAVGRFMNAVDHAETAEETLDGAKRAGQIRLSALAGILAAIILVAGGGIWFVRSRESAR